MTDIQTLLTEMKESNWTLNDGSVEPKDMRIELLISALEKAIEQREFYAEKLIGSAVDEQSDNAEIAKLLRGSE